jgi:ABC-type amino acid transport substrate-binding protein
MLGACTANRPTVRVAFDPGWRPLILQGLEPSLTGFSLELMAEIAKHESVQIEALRSSGQNLLYNLEAGAYTAILTTAAPTPELRKIFHFSEPVLFTGTSLVARVSHPLRSNQELKGLIIGVQSNSKAFSVLSGIPGISFKQYQSPLDALEDLSAGHLDAVAMERLAAITYCRNTFRGELTVLEQPLDPVPAIRLASKRDNRFFERLVKGMQKSPVEALQRRWGLAL